jgi:hypothetical protein
MEFSFKYWDYKFTAKAVDNKIHLQEVTKNNIKIPSRTFSDLQQSQEVNKVCWQEFEKFNTGKM